MMVGQALCTDPDIFHTLNLNDHWMRDFFVASLFLDLQRNFEGLARYQSLYMLFPRSDYILAQTATAHYNLREFDEAERLFEELLRSDPYRIEGCEQITFLI
jgi:anaphase-promoting complex subunit 8